MTISLFLINALAVLFVLLGFLLGFRQRLVIDWFARIQTPTPETDGPEDRPQFEDVASVLRMVGVMIMVFSFVSAVFADLIAYYSVVGT